MILRSLIKLESFGYSKSNMHDIFILHFLDKVLRFKTNCLVHNAACENCDRKKWLKLTRFYEKVIYKRELDL